MFSSLAEAQQVIEARSIYHQTSLSRLNHPRSLYIVDRSKARTSYIGDRSNAMEQKHNLGVICNP